METEEYSILIEDFENIKVNLENEIEKFKDKTILITGATGLIGSLLCKALFYISKNENLNIKLLAAVRDNKKVNEIFYLDRSTEYSLINFIYCDISNNEFVKVVSNFQEIDYIIHTASPTSSSYFTESPVETINIIYQGTYNVLEVAKKFKVKSMVYISSMEVYGDIKTVEAFESDSGFLETFSARSSYPQAKRLAETLCFCFSHEYGVHVKVIRPTLVFGPGVRKEDNRVFMQMARSVLNNKNIELATDGSTERDYIYTADSCISILSILLSSSKDFVYNISNTETYTSVLNLAKLFAKRNKNISIILNTGDSKIYSGEKHIKLNTCRLEKIKSIKMTSIDTMIDRLLLWLKNIR